VVRSLSFRHRHGKNILPERQARFPISKRSAFRRATSIPRQALANHLPSPPAAPSGRAVRAWRGVPLERRA